MENKFLKFYVDDEENLVTEEVVCENHIIGYEKLKECIGGYIEFVYSIDFGSKKIVAVVDDEGRIKDLKKTFDVLKLNKSMHTTDQEDLKIEGLYKDYFLVGPVLIVGLEMDEEGGYESVCLTEKQIDMVIHSVFVDEINKKYYLSMRN